MIWQHLGYRLGQGVSYSSQNRVLRPPRVGLSLPQVGDVGDVRPLPDLGRPRFMSRPRETLLPSFPRHCSPGLTEVTRTGRYRPRWGQPKEAQRG